MSMQSSIRFVSDHISHIPAICWLRSCTSFLTGHTEVFDATKFLLGADKGWELLKLNWDRKQFSDQSLNLMRESQHSLLQAVPQCRRKHAGITPNSMAFPRK